MTPMHWDGDGYPEPIDLSHPIDAGHFRWSTELQTSESLASGGLFNSSRISMPSHAFTHVDAPFHVDEEGQRLHEVDLRTWVGVARVVDLSRIPDASPIEASDLDRAAARVRPGEIVLLRTDWDSRRSVEQAAFWDDSPWVTQGAAEWLRDRGARAVGFDFPQDEPIRHAVAGKSPSPHEFITHQVLLRKGIGLIEYLRGLHQLPELVLLSAAPVSLVRGDGAPCRAVAFPLTEDPDNSESNAPDTERQR